MNHRVWLNIGNLGPNFKIIFHISPLLKMHWNIIKKRMCLLFVNHTFHAWFCEHPKGLSTYSSAIISMNKMMFYMSIVSHSKVFFWRVSIREVFFKDPRTNFSLSFKLVLCCFFFFFYLSHPIKNKLIKSDVCKLGSLDKLGVLKLHCATICTITIIIMNLWDKNRILQIT